MDPLSAPGSGPGRTKASTVYEVFAEAAGTARDLPFVVVQPDASVNPAQWIEYSYAESHSQIRTLREIYKAAGVEAGHRVALVLGNTAEHYWHLLALNSLRACAVPLNPDYLWHEFAHALRLADASLAVVAERSEEEVQRAARSLALPVPVWQVLSELPMPAVVGSPQPVPDADLKQAALIIFTSGTTSRPKGCLITNEGCFESGRSYNQAGGRIELRQGAERIFNPLPTFHMNATVLTLNAMLLAHGCLIVPRRFKASTWWNDLRITKATGFHYLGLIPPILLKAQQSGPDQAASLVRFGVGAGLDPVVHVEFERRFKVPLVEVWGMTETNRFIANSVEPRRTDTRAFGRAKDPLEVMVADKDGRPVSAGEPGELLVRAVGPDPRFGFFAEYVKDDAATAQAWAGDWFHTGDVVRQDADGMLFFVDRSKNIIRRSGENIAAAEVEEAMIGLGAVKAVVALSVPDELRDEEVLACVVLDSAAPKNGATATGLVSSLRGQLAKHKWPGWIQFVDALPLTATQKVRRDVLLSNFSSAAAHVHDVRVLKGKREKNQSAE